MRFCTPTLGGRQPRASQCGLGVTGRAETLMAVVLDAYIGRNHSAEASVSET
jgi:hypothetical protein